MHFVPCKKTHWTEHNDFKFYRYVVDVVVVAVMVENVFSVFAWLLIESQLTNAYRSYFIGIALDTLESNLLLHYTQYAHTHIIDGHIETTCTATENLSKSNQCWSWLVKLREYTIQYNSGGRISKN